MTTFAHTPALTTADKATAYREGVRWGRKILNAAGRDALAAVVADIDPTLSDYAQHTRWGAEAVLDGVLPRSVVA